VHQTASGAGGRWKNSLQSSWLKYDLVRGAEKQTYWISLKEYKMWRYYELGQDLKHYAPHLFEK
jgi:hypothetical protein